MGSLFTTQATIEESSGSISALTAEIEELAGKISASEADLANATEIRTSEKAAFEATEKELVETQDSLERALVMLKRSMTFMQTKGHKKAIEELATRAEVSDDSEVVRLVENFFDFDDVRMIKDLEHLDLALQGAHIPHLLLLDRLMLT